MSGAAQSLAAARRWKTLLALLPADAPIRPMLEERIKATEREKESDRARESERLRASERAEEGEAAGTESERARANVASHFGCGIITFKIPYLFRAPQGYNLLARGPANLFKDGISPLEGLIEVDWAVSPFTMNWKVTRPRARPCPAFALWPVGICSIP